MNEISINNRKRNECRNTLNEVKAYLGKMKSVTRDMKTAIRNICKDTESVMD